MDDRLMQAIRRKVLQVKEEREHKNPVNWTTRDEIEFLSQLGTYGRTPRTKKEILKTYDLYIAAADIRENWAGISRQRAIEAAKQHRAQVEARPE